MMDEKFIDPRALEILKHDRVAKELEIAACTEDAIRLGKEMTLILENEKPLTRVLVTRVLAMTYRQRFPTIHAAIEKLGL